MNTSSRPTIILDIEADDLNATVIHCIIVRPYGELNHRVFLPDSFGEFREYAKEVGTWVGHNILGFDAPTINRLLGQTIPLESCIDTLILSKLVNRKPKTGLGHSLAAWGQRLRLPKQEFHDFSKLSDEMIEYCKQDVNITYALYEFLKKKTEPYEFAVRLEHDMYLLCEDMHHNGFPFRYDEAQSLYQQLLVERNGLDERIHEAFGAKFVAVAEVMPKLTSKGTLNRSDFRWYDGDDYTIFESGAPFTRIKSERFNPASVKQVVDRLWDSGWKPVDRTDGHLHNEDPERKAHFERYGWKINERNLATLPESAPDGAKLLLKRLIINTRITQLESWFEAYSEKSGCIHGNFDSIGTWTHRMAHSSPNMANVAAKKSIKYNTPDLRTLATTLGGKMRSLWGIPDSSPNALVGTDAEGIQLRVFAHLINDAELIDSLVSGDKQLGTDPHTLNLKRINEKFGEGVCKDRDNAKMFIYAFFLGAGDQKVADIFNVKKKVGKVIKQYMYTIYPGLKKLRKRMAEDAKKGYFINVDGRPVVCDSEHHMLSGYLQAGEASIMKLAVRKAVQEMQADVSLLTKPRLINMVHDEMLFLCEKGQAKHVKDICEAAIAWAGEELKLNCPMKGEGKVGNDWLAVH